MWPFSKSRRSKRTVLVTARRGSDPAIINLEAEVLECQSELGAISFERTMAILKKDGRYEIMGTDRWGHWRPMSGWSDDELIQASFPPPHNDPARPPIERLALAVLHKDTKAYRMLIDAAIESLGG
jgi:hypothetical protein